MLEFLSNIYVILGVSIVGAIAIMVSLENEEEGLASGIISFVLALLLWNYGKDLWAFVSTNIATTIYFSLGYIILGMGWSMLKWNEFVKKKVEKFKAKRAEYLEQNKKFNDTDKIHLKGICDYLRNHGFKVWGTEVDSMKDIVVKIMPNGTDNKSSIIAWISYWPLSLTATLLNNPFRRLWLYIYSLCSGVYDKISMRHAKDLV
jgi:hypothetical protein